VPILWPFHKAHHTAEVLTPVTAFRVHPVDLLWTQSLANAATAPVTALFAWLFRDSVSGWTFLGANALIGATALLANLKHMQIWMTYGPLDRWWISPAHHQIHHSANPAHWGKNRGFELALWDRLCGTLHVPTREREVGALGIGDGCEARWHAVGRLYAMPFVEVWQLLLRRQRTLAGGAVLVLALLSAGDGRADPPTGATGPATVEIDRLTWPELAAQIKAGATTVLVPIGGLEQNGPAMALAKHNEIVRAAAAEIARRAGHVLVAPVLPFSPEGGFTPRAGNQQWPGTIGLREATLVAVLEDEVTSLALAGFTRIALLGDHGGSQAPQREVVSKLAPTLATRGVQLLSLDRYYDVASLAERLKALGVDPTLAGEHAGLVDTSELMSVAPELIRRDRLDPRGWTGYAAPGPGASGQPDLATAALGQALLEQRIRAAVAELRGDTEAATLAR
jgi:creatinine amidohydrolase/Fe(II)-dependent formamide hydrolase-like protein